MQLFYDDFRQPVGEAILIKTAGTQPLQQARLQRDGDAFDGDRGAQTRRMKKRVLVYNILPQDSGEADRFLHGQRDGRTGAERLRAPHSGGEHDALFDPFRTLRS